MRIELCVENVDNALAAQQGGADRVELCTGLAEGGLTPSAGMIAIALAALDIPAFAMVRPRGGDFLYSDAEHRAMLADIAAIRSAGAAGVVFGCLTADGRIDAVRMRELTEAARPLSVTCHRAFDMTENAEAALDTLIECGVDRVLTSGQQPTALEGISLLQRLIARAAGRIIVMVCGGLRTDTIARVVRETGASELHFSAPRQVPSGMLFRNDQLVMGSFPPEREYRSTVTDPELVRATIAAARAA